MEGTFSKPHPLEWANPNISAEMKIRTIASLLIPNPPRSIFGASLRLRIRAAIAIGMPMGTSLEMISSQKPALAKSRRALEVLPVSMPSGVSKPKPSAAWMPMIMMSSASVAPRIRPTVYSGVPMALSTASLDLSVSEGRLCLASSARDAMIARTMMTHAICRAVPEIVVTTIRFGTMAYTFSFPVSPQ